MTTPTTAEDVAAVRGLIVGAQHVADYMGRDAANRWAPALGAEAGWAGMALSRIEARLGAVDALVAACEDLVRDPHDGDCPDDCHACAIAAPLAALGCATSYPPPPAVDSKEPDQRPLFNKYRVERTDGSSAPGGKHHDCPSFVLDIAHDPFARPAIAAYADACRGAYPGLATDLLRWVDGGPFVVAAAPHKAADAKEPAACVTISLEDAMLLRRVYLPTNPNKMRNAAPVVVDFVRRFVAEVNRVAGVAGAGGEGG